MTARASTGPMSSLRVVAGALLILLLALLPGAAIAEGLHLRLDRVDRVASDAAEPPPDSAAWQPMPLRISKAADP